MKSEVMRDLDTIGSKELDAALTRVGLEPHAVKSDAVLKVRFFQSWSAVLEKKLHAGVKRPRIFTLPDKRFPIGWAGASAPFNLIVVRHGLAKYDDEIIYAVMAHELGHIVHKHWYKRTISFYAYIVLSLIGAMYVGFNQGALNGVSVAFIGLFPAYAGYKIWRWHYLNNWATYPAEVEANAFAGKVIGNDEFEKALETLRSEGKDI